MHSYFSKILEQTTAITSQKSNDRPTSVIYTRRVFCEYPHYRFAQKLLMVKSEAPVSHMYYTQKVHPSAKDTYFKVAWNILTYNEPNL